MRPGASREPPRSCAEGRRAEAGGGSPVRCRRGRPTRRRSPRGSGPPIDHDVDQAGRRGCPGVDRGAQQRRSAQVRPGATAGEPVQRHPGPGGVAATGHDETGAGDRDPHVRGQQHVEGRTAAHTGGDRDGEPAHAFQTADRAFPLGQQADADVLGPPRLRAARDVDHEQARTALVLGLVTDVQQRLDGLRRDRAAAVDVQDKILDRRRHHWTSAVSIVEPGPMVIRTPYSPGVVTPSLTSRS
jgi:hypothetical protein